MKKKVFSITKSDFEIQTFRSGGKGGQNQNKRDTGVRIIHKDSGISSECREERSQHQNKIKAFRKLIESEKFKLYIKRRFWKEIQNEQDIINKVEGMLKDENLKVEVFKNKKWEIVEKENE